MTKRRAFVGALMCLFASRPLCAQTVRGIVVDAGAAPVPGVVVMLVDSASNAAAAEYSNFNSDCGVLVLWTRRTP